MRRYFCLAAVAVLSGSILTSGCSQSAPKEAVEIDVTKERSANPVFEGKWELVGGDQLTLKAWELLIGDDAIATDLVGPPAISADGTRIAYSRKLEHSHGLVLSVIEHNGDGWSSPRVLVDEGTPDRVAISPDGGTVAFVAPANGIAAIWLVPFEGGEPIQLTNSGVKRDGPGEPEGFVPVPHRSVPIFEGNKLVWESPEGRHEAVLP